MKRIDSLLEKAKVFYVNGDPAHDTSHIKRVMNTCIWIAKKESVNLEILLAAAILHDIVNLPKNHPERLQASELAATKSRQFLSDAGFTESEIGIIVTVIIEHSYSLGKKPSSIESMILQDADKLDALGAIGVMRTLSCGSQMRLSYYDIEDPFASKRDQNDKLFTIFLLNK